MDNYGYGNTSYGGSGGGGGGGFMPGETSSPSGGGRNEDRNTTMRPITIKQALDATQPYPEASYQIDSQDVSSVVFVGQVRNISTQATNITYKLDDGTGEIEAKQWVTPDDSMDTTDESVAAGGKDRNGVEINGYAKVFGKLKTMFGDRKIITTHCVRPLTDINEVHFHFIEAAAVHLFFTRGPAPAAGGGGGSSGAKDEAMAGIDGGYGGPTGSGGSGGGNLPAMTPLAKRVYNLLRTEPQTNEGMQAQQIAAKLSVSIGDVARAGDELLNAAVIFSTVDEQTWAILDY
ncbi:hypothetical protein BJY01DRAFT_226396 [Aspergillus pseudoustus]|uniref:Replication protein A C-terminal domain-containing protein n=1 Tax=Aspergillus pseudoustus TaxID=1810923 RepID=A0ABR4IV72_9EURO